MVHALGLLLEKTETQQFELINTFRLPNTLLQFTSLDEVRWWDSYKNRIELLQKCSNDHDHGDPIDENNCSVGHNLKHLNSQPDGHG